MSDLLEIGQSFIVDFWYIPILLIVLVLFKTFVLKIKKKKEKEIYFIKILN